MVATLGVLRSLGEDVVIEEVGCQEMGDWQHHPQNGGGNKIIEGMVQTRVVSGDTLKQGEGGDFDAA